ncbi:MAG: DUF6318 family protein [Ancrocorticia sp.]
MNRKRMRTVYVLVATFAVSALVGCGGKEPTPATSETANVQVLSANPEPSRDRPVLEPPERLAAMDDPGKDGAIAAGEYLYRLSIYAAASGDTAEFENLSDEDCMKCADFVVQVNSLYESGGYWTSMPEVTIRDSRYLQFEEYPDHHVAILEVSTKSYRYVDGEGELHFANADAKIVAFIVTYSDGWVLVGIMDLPNEVSLESFDNEEQ